MRVLSVDGGGLVDVPAVLREHALKLTRQDALSIDDAGRATILGECAEECETYLGRLVVPVAGGRLIETVLQIDSQPLDPLPVMPRWPDVSGVLLTDSVFERWDGQAWVSATGSLRPAGRFELDDFRPGDFRVACTATPADTMPTVFIEGCSRLYAMRTTARPVDNTDGGTGATFNLSAALLRSGAAEVLRSIRRMA